MFLSLWARWLDLPKAKWRLVGHGGETIAQGEEYLTLRKVAGGELRVNFLHEPIFYTAFKKEHVWKVEVSLDDRGIIFVDPVRVTLERFDSFAITIKVRMLQYDVV